MKKNNKLKDVIFWTGSLLLILGVALTPMPETVGAQEQAEEYALEDIVVTASKRETKLMETPISVTAFSFDQLEKRGLRDFNEIITFIPGASEELAWTPGMRQYQLRGIAQGPGDPTVGYYYDDSAIFIWGASRAPMGRSFDLERVEALRGPQSTLYGNGSMGGTIRFIPKAPDLNDFEAHFRTGYYDTKGGNTSYYVDGAFSVPLVKDKLALRLVGQHESRGGYLPSVKNHPVYGDQFFADDYNDADLQNVRATLLWEPTDDLTLKLQYFLNDTYMDGTIFVRTPIHPPISVNLPGDFSDTEFEMFSGTVNYDFGFATLTSTFSSLEYFEENSQGYIDFDWQPPGSVVIWQPIQNAEAFNNETRLVSTGDGPFQWLLGMFYSESENVSNVFLFFRDWGIDIWPRGPDSLSESDSLSFFGEASWSFFDGKLIPLVGLRYFEDDREGTGFEPGTFDSVNPRFSLSYLPSMYSLYYLNIAKGFRSGTLNDPATVEDHLNDPDLPGLPAQRALDSDEIWSYEIGTKRTLLDGRMVLDVALYYQDWADNIQWISAGIFNAALAYQVGDAEIYGIDLGAVYMPESIPGLTLNLVGNWNEAEMKEIYDVLEPTLLNAQEGDRLPFVPKWTLGIGVDYSRQIAEGWMAQFNLSFSHVDAMEGQFDTGSVGNNRDLLRARIGLEGDRFGVYLFGNNLLSEDGAIYAQTPAGAIHTSTTDHPRSAGIEIQYKY